MVGIVYLRPDRRDSLCPRKVITAPLELPADAPLGSVLISILQEIARDGGSPSSGRYVQVSLVGIVLPPRRNKAEDVEKGAEERLRHR